MPRDVSWTQEIALAVGQESVTQDVSGVKVIGVYAGAPAPDFEAETLEQRAFRLRELRGKIVLLDFWATWCAPCVAELGTIKALHEEFAARGLEVVSVSFDLEADTARKFVSEKKLPWTHIWAERADKGPLAERYGVTAIPATFLIGPDGKVIARDLRGEALVQAVRQATADRPEAAGH